MNKFQLEVSQAILTREQAVLRELERTYVQALRNIDNQLTIFQGRVQTQSVFHQIQYRQNMQREINVIVVGLQSGNIATIQSYMKEAYRMGFSGMHYSLNKNGIPILSSLDPNRMLAAINFQIEGLTFANRQHVHMETFKRQIAHALNQGIAQNWTYERIAQQISKNTREQINNSYRIARTEGARVSSEANYQGMLQAQDAGADIVSEWSHAFNGDNSRDDHMALDGEIRELGEYFETASGNRTLRPLGFGIPEEDIHCRCILLQRARWVLSEEERQRRMIEIADLTQAKSFEDYHNQFYRR